MKASATILGGSAWNCFRSQFGLFDSGYKIESSERNGIGMDVKAWAQTDVGLKREINQDSILADSGLGLFIVADGMGGHKGGEVASAIAIETSREVIHKKRGKAFSPKEALLEAYAQSSKRIHHRATVESPDLMGMGTTMVMALIHTGRAYFANVGDSRAYLYRSGKMWQITEDHSLINEQVRSGVLTEEEAQMVLGRNVITRSVGFEKMVRVDIFERELISGERYLLCSDGISSMISDQAICSIMKQFRGPDAVAKSIQEAKRAGGDDNASTIIIDVL